MTASVASANAQRLDQWLWHARLFKTRTLAAKFVNDGAVRVTRAGATQRVTKASFCAVPGDILTYARGAAPRIIEIASLGKRRGPASEAAGLYIDRSPPSPPKSTAPSAPAFRSKGEGRPTKKDRRAIDALTGNSKQEL